MRMQASLLASAAVTAEVDTLRQNLERSEQELGRAKKQLEDNEGKKYLFLIYIKRYNCKKWQDYRGYYRGHV